MTKILLPMLLISGFLSAEILEVDKAHSEVGFKVTHMVVARVSGEFNEFDAEVEVKDDKLVSVKATIPVSSIDTGNEKRDEHLRNPDFFDVEKFPEITFVSTKVEAGKVTGNLTIKDVTKEVVMDLEFLGPAKNPWGKLVYGLNLEGEIDRTAFGLTWNKALETGGVMVGETVKIAISVELNK